MSQLQIYNCVDAIATFQLMDKFEPLLDKYPDAAATYRLNLAVQAPALYAMARGVLVDPDTVASLRDQFTRECKILEANLDFITLPLKMGRINFGSPTQVKWLLECFGVQLTHSRNWKTKGATSTDRDALERIRERDPEIAPIINILLAWRDRAKMLSILKPELIDQDGRIRSFYKVVGTRTGRWSSAQNAWSSKDRKSGMNKQNLKRDEDEEKSGHASIRSMFIADKGMKLCAVDLERADSFGVALEIFRATGDRKYLDACSAIDLHTYVSRLVWPKLGWTGDWPHDIALAKTFFYRQFDYRFMSKKLGHGSCYLGTPRTLASQMKIPTSLAETGVYAFFRAFPAIKVWHSLRAKELQTTGSLTNIWGRRRNFHSRLDDMSTLREAIGWCGQSSTADSINRSLLRLFACQIQMPDLCLDFLDQIHDEIVFQFPEENEEEILNLAKSILPIPVTVHSPSGEPLTTAIPLSYATGWNYAKRSPSNPDGLAKPLLPRKRIKPAPEIKLSRLSSRLSSIY